MTMFVEFDLMTGKRILVDVDSIVTVEEGEGQDAITILLDQSGRSRVWYVSNSYEEVKRRLAGDSVEQAENECELFQT